MASELSASFVLSGGSQPSGKPNSRGLGLEAMWKLLHQGVSSSEMLTCVPVVKVETHGVNKRPEAEV